MWTAQVGLGRSAEGLPWLCLALLLFVSPIGCAGAGGGGNAGNKDGGATDPGAVALACSASNGSRLQAQYVTAPDGTKRLWGWLDTLRHESCGFSTAADGKLHCLPFDGVALNDLLYADSGCTKPVTIVLARGCPPAYHFSTGYSTDYACSGAWHVRPVMGLMASPPVLYKSAGSTCTTFAEAVLPSYQVFALGAEIDPSAFVGGAEMAPPATKARLSQMVLAASDGSRQQCRDDGFLRYDPLYFDHDRMETCTFRQSGMDVYCLPGSLLSGQQPHFSDAQCKQPAVDISSCDPASKLVAMPQPGASVCTGPLAVFALGPAAPMTYANASSSCIAFPPAGGVQSYALGQPIDLGVFSKVSLATDAPFGDHLVTRDYRMQDGFRTFRGWFQDASGVRCQFRWAHDGMLRCIPEAYRPHHFFQDASCRTPLELAAAPACATGTPHAFYYDAATTCPARMRVFALGARFTGMAYWKEWDGKCIGWSPASDPGSTYYALGAEIDPATLPAGKLVME